MKFFYWIIYILVYIPLRIIFPFKVIGKENLPDRKGRKGMIVVSNHLSWYDVILIPLAIPGFRYSVSKKENGTNAFVRGFLKLLGAVFIDRDNIEVSSMRQLVKILKDGKGITLFPEGTRNRNGLELQPIKSGTALIALQGNATVLPAMIAKRPKAFKKNYVYIAEPIKICEHIERPYNGEKINSACDMIAGSMADALKYIRNYADEKSKKRKDKAK